MTDNDGFPAGTARPWDLAAEAGYARIFGKRIAVSLTARYVRSDLDIGEAPFQGVSFDLAAALRGGFGKSGKAGWTAGIRVADLGPEVSGSDGRSLRLPTRGSAEGALWLTPHRNHTLRVALDLGYRFSGGPFDASFGAEYLFLRHGALHDADVVQRAADLHIPRIAQHILTQLHGQKHAPLVVRLHAGIAEPGDVVKLLLHGRLAAVEGVELVHHALKRLVGI